MAVAQLAVFVRPPVAGSVKTRLASSLGDHGAAALYEAFVEDTLRVCARIRAAGRVDVAIWHAGAEDDHTSAWAARVDGSLHAQPEGSLGDRLDAAFSQGLALYERVVVIGSDAPTLPPELLVAAFDSLVAARLVLGPTSDGGYYAIGASEGARPCFDRVRWSTAHTFADTRSANPNVPLTIIPPWYDVDEPADLRVLRAHLSVDPSAAPSTAARLKAVAYK